MENKVYTAIGMMSGTSMDGIDVALVKTDGMDQTQLLDFQCFPYEDSTKEVIRSVLRSRHASDATATAERLLTNAHIAAIKESGFEADVIGFHGQTIFHDPSQRVTWQIGESQRLADETGMDVVGDMRQADIEAGGQGAPLLPLCHRAFASDLKKPVAILNLGGVGNITYLGTARDDILAFDTGPGSALIDDLVKHKTAKDFDWDGKLARSGTVDKTLVGLWLTHPYFMQLPPKSLDRDEWEVREVYDMSLEDGVATLTNFTLHSILHSITHLPVAPTALYVTGGGRHNKFLMERLNASLPYPVEPVEAIGWNGDGLEAQGFGYLAVRSLKGLALTLPTTTGINEPATGGKLYKASSNSALRAASTR